MRAIQVSRSLCDQSAVWLRDAIRTGAVTSSEILESCINRIQACNPTVNAVVTDRFLDARKEAKVADKRNIDDDLGLLHGLPVLVKDLTATAGTRTTFGSKAFANHVPKEDDPIVKRLRDAGAIILGKTNTPEFGAGANTKNDVFGVTRNPYDVDKTSGGSSGGSAAGVAMAMAPLATGSDFGGSLRIPAAYCGVVGFRASPGWVAAPNRVLGYSPIWIEGPIARNVPDVALMFDVMRGYNPTDPLSHLGSGLALSKPTPSLTEQRIGISSDLGLSGLDENIIQMFKGVSDFFRERLPNIDEVNINLSSSVDIFRVLRAQDILANHAQLARTVPELLGENIRNNIIEAQSLSFEEGAAACKSHTVFAKDFQRIFDNIDLLICPTCAVPPFPVTQNHPEMVAGQPISSYYGWYALTYALSLTGSPVINLPAGRDPDGMPFGIQVIMRRDADLKLISLACELEEILKERNGQ